LIDSRGGVSLKSQHLLLLLSLFFFCFIVFLSHFKPTSEDDLGIHAIQKASLSCGLNLEIGTPIFCGLGRIDSHSADTYRCRPKEKTSRNLCCICAKATRLHDDFALAPYFSFNSWRDLNIIMQHDLKSEELPENWRLGIDENSFLPYSSTGTKINVEREDPLGAGMIPKLIGAAAICGQVLAGQPTCQFECSPGHRLACKWTGCGDSRSCIQSNPNSILRSNRICRLKGGASSDSSQTEDECCKCEPKKANDQNKNSRSPEWDDDLPHQGTFIVPPFPDPPDDKNPPYDIPNPQKPDTLPKLPPYEHPLMPPSFPEDIHTDDSHSTPASGDFREIGPGYRHPLVPEGAHDPLHVPLPGYPYVPENPKFPSTGDEPDPDDIPDFPGIDAIVGPGSIDTVKPLPPSSSSNSPPNSPPKSPPWPGNKVTAQRIFDFHLDHYRDHRTFEAIRLRDDIDYDDAGKISFKVVKSELDHQGTLYKGLLTDAMQFSGLLFTMRLKTKYPHVLEDIKFSGQSGKDTNFSLRKFQEEFFQSALEKDKLTIITEIERLATTWISLRHTVFLSQRGEAEFIESNPVIIASAISMYDFSNDDMDAFKN